MQLLTGFKSLLKRLLRGPANALLASATNLPERVDECVVSSPQVREVIETCLAAGMEQSKEQSDGVPLESLEAFVKEGTGPYPYYVEEARKRGMDVNDYLEQVLENGSVLPYLEAMVFPYLREDSIVCELGPATGVFSREILKKLGHGRLHLVDYSPWFVRFLSDYFHGNSRVQVHGTDGKSLPTDLTARVDVVVSFGTFVMLKLGLVYRYAHEFARVLKPGGHAVIEFLDLSTPQAWSWLETHSTELEPAATYTYFTPDVMEAVFAMAGFDPVYRGFVPGHETGHPMTFLIVRRRKAAALST